MVPNIPELLETWRSQDGPRWMLEAGLSPSPRRHPGCLPPAEPFSPGPASSEGLRGKGSRRGRVPKSLALHTGNLRAGVRPSLRPSSQGSKYPHLALGLGLVNARPGLPRRTSHNSLAPWGSSFHAQVLRGWEMPHTRAHQALGTGARSPEEAAESGTGERASRGPANPQERRERDGRETGERLGLGFRHPLAKGAQETLKRGVPIAAQQ